jgi:hypothetical protein
VTYHVVCKDSQGAIQKEYDQSTWGSPFAYDPWCDDEEQPLPKLGGDGVTAQGSYACHETSYSWGFTASPEE